MRQAEKKILILTTAGKKSGLGHLARMLPLREELLKREITADIYIHDTGEAPFFSYAQYGAWSFANDNLARLTASYDGVVVDSYFPDEATFRAIKSPVKIAIDDFDRLAYPVNAVIRPSIHVWGDNTCQYATVYEGAEFIVINEILKSELVNNPKSSALFITAGGGSNTEVLQTFCLAAKQAGIKKAHVVCGGSEDFATKKHFFDGFSFYGSLSPQEYARVASLCGLALVSCGVSLSEMAYAGIPSVGVVISDDQRLVAKGFCEAKFLERSIDITSASALQEITKDICKLTKNAELRKKRSYIGKTLISGKGALCMAEIILREVYGEVYK